MLIFLYFFTTQVVYIVMAAAEQQLFKHIPLSKDRPTASNPREVLIESEEKAFSLLGQYAKWDEDKIKEAQVQKLKYDVSAALTMSKRCNIVENRTAVLGSTDKIYSQSNTGFFETVLMAYNHHYNLRTSPEDWWYCVIRRVALAIDNNSSKASVRKMFVEHQGKKTLTVVVPEWPLSNVNYSSFFDKMSNEITKNVKVPEYVDAMTANFSCTTNVQRIVSQITLMSSMQEFFEYKLMMMCGIPAIEMLGTEADWQKLLTDLKALKAILKPIMSDIQLTKQWWSLAEEIFTKLLDTYRGKPNKKWWSHIISYNAMFGSGFREHPNLPPDYSGWIVEFLEGRVGLESHEFTSGLVTVPLKIVDGFKGVEDTAALVAGMVGMTVHEETGNNRPSVQPFQGWALMLPPNSPLTV